MREAARPGTEAWRRELSHHIDQARRNDTDFNDVTVLRQAKIRRTADDDERLAEELALAEIESRTGRCSDAEARLTRVLVQRRIPEATRGFLHELTARTARAARNDGRGDTARRLFDDALAIADAHEDRDLGVALLIRRASFEHGAYAIAFARAASTEGLRRLGWCTGPDPYRLSPSHRRDLDSWDRRAIMSLLEKLVSCLGYDGAYEEAHHVLTEWTELADDDSSASRDVEDLIASKAWIDYRQGGFERARRGWKQLHERLAAKDTAPDARLFAVMINRGWACLRLTQYQQAAEIAKTVLGYRELGNYIAGRAHGLAADAALCSGDPGAARQHARQALSYASDPLTRSGALRVLAEVHADAGEAEDALRVAQQAVDELSVVLGDDLFLVDRLLTLARAAARKDPALAEATLLRATKIPLPDGHPHRRELMDARAGLVEKRGD